MSGLVLATLAILVAVVWRYGPGYGVYVLPPSPEQYAEAALDRMDQGYFAQGEEWAAARAEAVRQTRGAEDYAATLPALRQALAVAGGEHSRLFEAGEGLAAADLDRPLPAVSTQSGVTTLTVPKLTADDEESQQRYADTLGDGIHRAREETECGWIIDVRRNHGGDMDPMLAGLSPLLPDGRVVGFKNSTGSITWAMIEAGSVRIADSVTMSVKPQAKVDQPVAVVHGPDTGSSAEVVVLAFRGLRNTRSFGQTTAGYSSSNQSIHLYDGTQMLLTTAVDVDRTGTSTEGGPIPPDEATPLDDAADIAQEWLRNQCEATAAD